MTWFADPKKNRAYELGETGKIRWEVLGWCQGNGLDVGCGSNKVFPWAIGVDRSGRAANIAGDVTRLSGFADNHYDFLFSSHCLEDLQDTESVLKDWWRVIRPGGHLVLYLPHKDHYPNIGQRGGNPAHKHDFVPEDIVKVMKSIAPDWVLRENQERSDGDEYSFLQVYTKQAPGFGQFAKLEESDPAKRCIAIRFGGYGDVLVAGSTFPHLKAEGWHLTVYTGDKGADVLKHDPSVDRVVVVDVLQQKQGDFRLLCEYLRGRCARFINFSESFEGLLLASPSRVSYHWPHAMRHRYMNGNYMEAAHEVAGVPQDYRQKHYATDAELAEARAWRAERGIKRLVVAAACGSGANKIWPGLFEYVWRVVDRNPDTHVAVLGDLRGAKLYEHERIHEIGTTWPVRRSLAFAIAADLVIGQETGILNAVALEPMPKIVLLSHSSAENLTKHWTNTATLVGDVPCYPCHRLHADWSGCNQDPETQFAACQSKITPMMATELTERLLGVEHRAAA